MSNIATLVEHGADLKSSETRLKFCGGKSAWLQERVNLGYEDAVGLWNIG